MKPKEKQDQDVIEPPPPNDALEEVTNVAGTLVGAAVGIAGGPFGVLAGAVVGSAMGSVAGEAMQRSEHARAQEQAELDEEIGVYETDKDADAQTSFDMSPWADLDEEPAPPPPPKR